MQFSFDSEDLNAPELPRILRALADVLAPQETASNIVVKMDANDAVHAVLEAGDEVVAAVKAAQGHSVLTPVTSAEAADAPPAVDAEGYPWDARIHSAGRTINADGTWRVKRGVSDEEFNSVRAEFRAQRLPAPPTEAERIQTEMVQDLGPDPIKVGFGAQVPPAPPADSDWPESVLGPCDPNRDAFQQFVGWAVKAMQDGKFDNGKLLTTLQTRGVPTLPMLAQRQELIPEIVRELV